MRHRRAAWLFSSAFVNSSYQGLRLDNVEISFISDNQHQLITKQEVIDMISSYGIVKNVSQRNGFDINSLEKKFIDHPAVETAEVFFVNNGKFSLFMGSQESVFLPQN